MPDPAPTPRRLTLDIEGMTCGSCVSHVEGALRRVQGVSDALVNLATRRATVTVDPSGVGVDRLIEAVRRAGYEARQRNGESFSTGGSASDNGRPHIGPAGGGSGVEGEAVGEHADEAGHVHGAVTPSEAGAWKRRAILGMVLAAPVAILGMFVEGVASGVVQLVLTLALQVYIGKEYYTGAWRSARHGRANMDTLVALGTTAATAFSVYTLARGERHFYFDTAAVILALIALGKWLEARARGESRKALESLLTLRPPTALVERAGVRAELPLDQVRSGDTVVMRPGGRVPVDGVILDGRAVIDESMVTGEAMPVDKALGAVVIGGTVNQTGAFRYRATALGRDSLLGRIVDLVDRAQASKASIQRLADRVAGVFVPIVLAVAAATLVGWGVAAQDWPRGVVAAISVLIVACPCALGLAVPTAVMVGTGVGARRGIIIKNAAVLEECGRLDTVVLDKTGTITAGRPEVTDVAAIAEGMTEAEVLRLAGAVEASSEHPLGRAIVRAAADRSPAIGAVSEFASLTGGGVSGRIEGRTVFVGRVPESVRDARLEVLEASGKTVVGVFEQTPGVGDRPLPGPGRLLGVIALADSLKPDAAESVEELKRLGLGVILMTGDHARAAEAVARQVGVSRVLARVLPHEKEAAIRAERAAGRRVAMVGDGINDAPALAASDVGIAMGTGTDIAKEAGDIVLVSGDLAKVPEAIRLSRAMMRRIRLGLFWAFAYNAVLVPAAALGYLHPMFAAAAMGLSSASVVANALLLNRLGAGRRAHPAAGPRPADGDMLVPNRAHSSVG